MYNNIILYELHFIQNKIIIGFIIVTHLYIDIETEI